VHYESRVPTEWEKTHLPIIILAREDWSPSQEVFTDDGGVPERLVTGGAAAFTDRHIELITEVAATDAHHVTCDGTRTPESEPCGGTRNRLSSTEMMKA
jgi:hypothetical protein